jgi:oligoribonuclease NrnB/cAMP/cGMP phosphodiesterase (DHH superfamily)
MNTTVIHHDDPDGWVAAWVLRRECPDAVCVPTNYGQPVPWDAIIAADRVWIVDFSYPLDTLHAIADGVPTTVIDHHVTAAAVLAGIPAEGARLCAVYDVRRSGCGLTWDTLHPGEPRPWIVDYVEDHDLWRFVLPFSREIRASLSSYMLGWALLDWFADNDASWWSTTSEGVSILRYQGQVIADMCVDPPMQDGVPCVPCHSPRLISELGHALSEHYPYAMVYRTCPDGSRRVSLRSREGRADVSEIARAHGGGGHVHAAGYTIK